MNLGDLRSVVPFDQSFDALVGFSFDAIDEEEVRGHFDVRPALFGQSGVVSLGVFTSVAEGAASMGTVLAVVKDGMSASGLSNDTVVNEDVTTGRIEVVARRRAQQPDVWTWEVEARDEQGRVCAFSRLLIAVRPLR